MPEPNSGCWLWMQSLVGIEIIALKKLSLVSHALAQKIGGEAGREQTMLAKTLDDLILQIELKASQP